MLVTRGLRQRIRAASLPLVVWLMLVAGFTLAGPARGALFVFGDSISDTGNGCLLPILLAQELPGSVDIPDDLLDECRGGRYFLGRTTHGPVWAEVLASGLVDTSLLGVPLNALLPSLPDVGLSADLSAEQRELATRWTLQWNQALAAVLDRIDDPDVTRLDAFCLTEALIDFGRLDTERTCSDSVGYPGCTRVSRRVQSLRPPETVCEPLHTLARSRGSCQPPCPIRD